MGKTTQALTNHNLDTSSLIRLATDLSKRLKCTIECGYEQDFDFELELKNEFPSFNRVVLHTVTYKNSSKTLSLLELDYATRQFVKHEQAKPALHPYLIKNPQYFEQHIKTTAAVSYELSDIVEGNYSNNWIATIYKHSLEVHEVDSCGWRSFQRFYAFKTDKLSQNSMLNWRKTLQQWIQTFGGTALLIGCEEDKSYALFKCASQGMLWHELKQFAFTNFDNGYINISEFFNTKKWNDLNPYLTTYLPPTATSIDENNWEYYGVDETSGRTIKYDQQNDHILHEVYFDDFKDL